MTDNTKNSESSHFQKGLQYFRKNALEKAVEHWEKATQQESKNAEIFSVLGGAYKLLNDFDRSSNALKKALDLEPDNFKYIYNYGLILFEQKRYREALEKLHYALKLHPDNFELINDIAVMYFNIKDYKKAEEYLTRATELNPDYYFALVNLGYVYLYTERLKDAVDVLKRLDMAGIKSIEVSDFRQQLKTMQTSKSVEDLDPHLEMSEKTYEIEPIHLIKDFEFESVGDSIDLSIVVPIMNEEGNIQILYDQIQDAMKKLNQTFEIIFIDDGSRDKSLAIMKDIAKKDPGVRVIQFRRNYGQTAAMSAGFKYAHGAVIITMDGDLQNDPADIPRLLEKMSEGYDLVSGWRKDRKDKAITRKLPSKVANALINKLIAGTGIQLHDFGCTLKAYKRGIVKNINLYGEMHRFIPVFAAWIGVKVTEIPVKHHPRIHGYAKYNLSRVTRVIFDLLVVRFFSDYMTRPIQFFGKIAKKILFTGTGILFAAGLVKGFYALPFSWDTLLILFGILCVSSFQIVIMGLLGEMIIRHYFEGQKKDYYIVENIHSKDTGIS